MVEGQLMFNTALLNNSEDIPLFTDLLAIRNVLFQTPSLEVIVNTFIASTNN